MFIHMYSLVWVKGGSLPIHNHGLRWAHQYTNRQHDYPHVLISQRLWHQFHSDRYEASLSNQTCPWILCHVALRPHVDPSWTFLDEALTVCSDMRSMWRASFYVDNDYDNFVFHGEYSIQLYQN